jgi:hypothetical protein
MTIVTASDQAPAAETDGQGAPSVTHPTASAPEPAGRAGWSRFAAIGRYYPVFLIFLIWEALSRLDLLDPMFMPPLEDVARAFYREVFVTHELLFHIKVSFMRAGAGLGLAAVVGIAAGILMGRVRAIESFLDPLISALFPTPKLALFPLMMIFLGIGDASKIALIFLGCFFPDRHQHLHRREERRQVLHLERADQGRQPASIDLACHPARVASIRVRWPSGCDIDRVPADRRLRTDRGQ